jgi:hypothetical protein
LTPSGGLVLLFIETSRPRGFSASDFAAPQ